MNAEPATGVEPNLARGSVPKSPQRVRAHSARLLPHFAGRGQGGGSGASVFARGSTMTNGQRNLPVYNLREHTIILTRLFSWNARPTLAILPVLRLLSDQALTRHPRNSGAPEGRRRRPRRKWNPVVPFAQTGENRKVRIDGSMTNQERKKTALTEERLREIFAAYNRKYWRGRLPV